MNKENEDIIKKIFEYIEIYNEEWAEMFNFLTFLLDLGISSYQLNGNEQSSIIDKLIYE